MAGSSGFRATMKATETRGWRSRSARSRDLLLLPCQSRHVDRLPPGARVVTLRGCGHVPMADGPAAVAALVLGA